LTVRRTRDLDVEHDRMLRAGVRPISREDPTYPALLRELVNGPPLIYVRGTLAESDRWALAVVGTRGATTYGREATRKLVADLAAERITIISKLATKTRTSNVLGTAGSAVSR
ncbi:MAG TPA: DNA-processing protein DprA, partial [Herpetosiphonaceae bacterium]|nr:DNA-processing protein DprA [Herpetosiphonaceae bacterium]